ncbi:MAG: type II toxin-antitoxin system VapC family toxin [Candidatus Cloacimonadota bacterium]|nr:type II toxin-antitoxin system VapC family toxin [Candidatus Cloacimonadota bacterium]
MANRKILIDTSIVIEYVRKKNKAKTILYELYKSYDELFISSITVFEIFVGVNIENVNLINQLFEGFRILPFDLTIAKIASQVYNELKSQNKIIEFRDIFIAATAIGNSLSVVTLNTKDFERIPNLEILKSF